MEDRIQVFREESLLIDVFIRVCDFFGWDDKRKGFLAWRYEQLIEYFYCSWVCNERCYPGGWKKEHEYQWHCAKHFPCTWRIDFWWKNNIG